jgi:hypothetical protein
VNWFNTLFRSKKTNAAPTEGPGIGPAHPGCPWPLTVTKGERALETVLALRNTAAPIVPVALGDDDDLERILDALEYNRLDALDIIGRGERLNLSEWIEQRIAADPDYYHKDEGTAEKPSQAAPLTLALDFTGRPKPRIHIAHIPAEKPWQVPAHLGYGGWNECPSAEEHVAFFKSWFERYSAVVVGIGPDTIEFTVEMPPATLEEARVLAREQFVYCADIVHQGVQTVENLATVLVNGRNWYFWWD